MSMRHKAQLLALLVLALVVAFMAIGPPTATASANILGSGQVGSAPPLYAAGTMDMMEVPAVAWRSPSADRTVIRSAAFGNAVEYTTSLNSTITATTSRLAKKGHWTTTAPALESANTATSMPPSTVPGGHRKTPDGGKDEGPTTSKIGMMASVAGYRPNLA